LNHVASSDSFVAGKPPGSSCRSFGSWVLKKVTAATFFTGSCEPVIGRALRAEATRPSSWSRYGRTDKIIDR